MAAVLARLIARLEEQVELVDVESPGHRTARDAAEFASGYHDGMAAAVQFVVDERTRASSPWTLLSRWRFGGSRRSTAEALTRIETRVRSCLDHVESRAVGEVDDTDWSAAGFEHSLRTVLGSVHESRQAHLVHTRLFMPEKTGSKEKVMGDKSRGKRPRTSASTLAERRAAKREKKAAEHDGRRARKPERR